MTREASQQQPTLVVARG